MRTVKTENTADMESGTADMANLEDACADMVGIGNAAHPAELANPAGQLAGFQLAGFQLAEIPPATLLKGRTASGESRWFYSDERPVVLPSGAAASGVPSAPSVLLRVLPPETGLGDLLALPRAELQALLATQPAAVEPPAELLAPVDGGTEVWAAGVTYLVSKQARMEESAEADVYDRVYQAQRPELFFKAVGWRVSGPSGPVGIRRDSPLNVPEPEAALVLNSAGDIVGFTVGNDMSSRSIEGENPLYLPQAKVYRHSCAVGPWIRMAWAVRDPEDMSIDIGISRSGQVVWKGSTSTSQLKRGFGELASYLFRADIFPRGAVLLTGTSAVPGMDFSLLEGDVVRIDVGGVGSLSNVVVTV
jgi:2-dehydro-3-deoxy-D-arabinonate dehydratase